jgi:TetR/AcrR family acrAB operon transcriptional repressor
MPVTRMVRRTKAEAEATRTMILDAAERLFERHGVSRTSLQHIATAAGVTRGAIYHHFSDKADLFDAMMRRVKLPMEQAAAQLEACTGAHPLERLRALLMTHLERVAGDPQTQRVFEIAMHKVEDVEELSGLRQRHRDAVAEHIATIARCLERAGLPAMHAIALHALVSGLLRTWLLDRSAFPLVPTGAVAIDAMLAGLG